MRDLELLDVACESFVWLSAWLIWPAYLSLSGVSLLSFLIYGFGAGALVSVGVILTYVGAFAALADMARYVGRCCLAVLASGGVVFLALRLF